MYFLKGLTSSNFLFGSNAYKTLVIDQQLPAILLFEGGIFFLLAFAIFYVLSTVNMINKKAWIPICIIMSFMAYGLMETLLLFSMVIGTNIFWVMLYYYYKNGEMKL